MDDALLHLVEAIEPESGESYAKYDAFAEGADQDYLVSLMIYHIWKSVHSKAGVHFSSEQIVECQDMADLAGVTLELLLSRMLIRFSAHQQLLDELDTQWVTFSHTLSLEFRKDIDSLPDKWRQYAQDALMCVCVRSREQQKLVAPKWHPWESARVNEFLTCVCNHLSRGVRCEPGSRASGIPQLNPTSLGDLCIRIRQSLPLIDAEFGDFAQDLYRELPQSAQQMVDMTDCVGVDELRSALIAVLAARRGLVAAHRPEVCLCSLLECADTRGIKDLGTLCPTTICLFDSEWIQDC